MNAMKTRTIGTSTPVTIGLISSLVPVIFFLAKTSFAGDQNTKDVDTLRQSVKEMQMSVVVDLRDQAANISEVRTQNMVINANLNALNERVERLLKRQESKGESQ